MKIKVDQKNKVVVATGYFGDKFIKAVARCKKGDDFNEAFGIKLVEEKYKLLKKKEQLKIHKNILAYCAGIKKSEIDACCSIENRISEQENVIKGIVEAMYGKK